MLVSLPIHSQKPGIHPRLLVPPSPGLLARMQARQQERLRLGETATSIALESFTLPPTGATKMSGLNDGRMFAAAHAQPERIDRPQVTLRGTVQTLVLLVDFSDKPHDPENTVGYYEQMLFGEPGVFPTGSMREYYRQVSQYEPGGDRGIDVQGQVIGWLRLPHPSTYYTDNSYGMDGIFPQNAQGMAADAVQAALAAGVDFRPFDSLGQNTVTALFIIHAGAGAEETGSVSDFWSLKWMVPDPIPVAPHLRVETFLTVPESCHIGVCAHEWGHLAAQWADYYDTDTPPFTSNGLGDFCLMSSGSWGNNGLHPTYPNGMLRMFHNWVETIDAMEQEETFTLQAAAEGGQLLRIQNPAVMSAQQYVLVEYRRRKGQDNYLPDQGIAVYVVDEAIQDVNEETRLAIELLQADNKRHLARVSGGNRGDDKDLYPYQQNALLGQETKPPLNLPGSATWSGITIQILNPAGGETMDVKVTID